jgi:glycosyltransferase involved in cell wall biosynthesis
MTFSFLIPVYCKDKVETLKVCIYSVLNQTISANEILIVCEGNLEDQLIDFLTSVECKYNNIKVLFIPKQIGPLGFGLPSTLNFGILNASSEYVVRLDSDDYSVPNRLEEIRDKLIEFPELELIGSNIIEYDENLVVPLKKRIVPENMPDILKIGKWINPFNGPSVAFRRVTAIKLGGYPLVGSNEDYCLWASFLKFNLPCYNIQKELVFMRAGDSLIKRRSSIRYIKGEFEALKYLFGIGYFNFFLFLLHVVLKILIRLLPFKILKHIYYNLFRK